MGPTTNRATSGFVFFLLLASGSLLAIDVDRVPPENWTVPAARAGIRTTMTDATPPRAFIGLTPCRIVDTRGNGAPITGGTFSANQVRTWQLTGKCGLPAGADAVSLNLTVTGTAASLFGFASIWPAGSAQPPTSNINWNAAAQTISNAVIVPLGTSGSVSVVSGNAGADMVLDINGYFSSVLGTPSNSFDIANNSGVATAHFSNASTGCSGACGISAGVQSGTAISASSATGGDGVFGFSADASGAGVHGRVSSNVADTAGVFGEHTSAGSLGSGVVGRHSGTGTGVTGLAVGASGVGARGVFGLVNSTTDGAIGVEGIALGGSGVTYGMYASTASAASNAAGIRAIDGTGPPRYAAGTSFFSAGVRGESATGIGMFGISESSGVVGALYDSEGNSLANGFLATTFGTAANTATGPWAVFALGNLGASGAKHFVEPHPTDATKTITYSSLEGREVGTYFRGAARIVNHRAVIHVPEDFRAVTDDEGLTVQLTAVGAAATMFVESVDLNTLVINASRDIQVHYLVQGVRRAFRDFQPVGTGYEFMPASPDAKMPANLTEEAKRRLVSNGTYNPDGTVNMETAEKAGFARIWAAREAEAKVRAQAAAAKTER